MICYSTEDLLEEKFFFIDKSRAILNEYLPYPIFLLVQDQFKWSKSMGNYIVEDPYRLIEKLIEIGFWGKNKPYETISISTDTNITDESLYSYQPIVRKANLYDFVV